jgi:hypothetical protein
VGPPLELPGLGGSRPVRRYKAIHLHVETVMAAFNAPVDEAGMLHMQEYADVIRENVMGYQGISKKKRKKAASCCTAEVVVDAIRKEFLIRDFRENGLTAGISDAHNFFAGGPQASPYGGGKGWEEGGSGSWSILCRAVTGLDF